MFAPKQTYMLFQNDIPIDVACHPNTLKIQVSSGTKNKPYPNKPSCTTVTVSFNCVLLVLTGTCRSPYLCPARTDCKLNLESSENITQDHYCGVQNACSQFQVNCRFYLAQWRKKHQRQSISLETKIAILYRLGKGEGCTAIGKHFNLGESTVRAIKKNESTIRKSVISGTKLSTKFASYTRNVLLERTERAIAIWTEEQVQRRIPVSGYLIQEKALQCYKSMKQSEPSTSTSQAGKEFSATDEGAAKIFPEELAKFIEDGDYSADQVFNADETGHYWKKLPNRTYIAKDEKTASGHKASKDRVTLLLSSNASGDRMLKSLLINKSRRPRALKDLTVDGVVVPEGDNNEEEKSTPLTGKKSRRKGRATQNENEVCENPWPLPQISIAETVSSDDEGDLEPLRKRCKPLSDSDND
ncbi:tigger transposable element-derived protein 1 [Trichonephila clavipes]|uniref:Tigger transposable element-derived protein 1 n=1 Tax=Trichonephila clavipes TaxID=2585209 RepID=A0A8X6RZH0_TRICX|nr:tigger transposable element-derived protein 1 [Trichonephila clavipes]